MESFRLPAEWEEQDAVLLIWPHAATDWQPVLPEVNRVYIALLSAIAKSERVVIVTPEAHSLSHRLAFFMPALMKNITLVDLPTNDTWARDCAPISLVSTLPATAGILLDFGFNGWGGKFPARLDNLITRRLCERGLFTAVWRDCLDFVLEGGSIDTDGQGTLLTTARCLLNPNRNPHLSQALIEQRLKDCLGIKRILWLRHGALLGDDTDGHIDMLARFVAPDTIAYTACNDPSYPCYNELKLMESELRSFRTTTGKPYTLLPLPIAPTDDGLPASYTNFLITNTAVLLPDYGDESIDTVAQTLQSAFPTRSIIPIPARPLLRQGGSIHCSTMQIPKGFLNTNH